MPGLPLILVVTREELATLAICFEVGAASCDEIAARSGRQLVLLEWAAQP
jgi:hypothetical protein